MLDSVKNQNKKDYNLQNLKILDCKAVALEVDRAARKKEIQKMKMIMMMRKKRVEKKKWIKNYKINLKKLRKT